MERKGRSLLAQPDCGNLLRNRYYEGSGTALRKKCPGIDDNCAQFVAEVSKRSVSDLKMLALVRNDESNNIFSNENGGTLIVVGQLPQNANPFPE